MSGADRSPLMPGEGAPTREQLMHFVFTLRQSGVTEPRVLDAMEKTPRHLFVEKAFKHRAWEDIPLPIACGQTISQPSVVGIMSQALRPTPRCKVLEVGCGSGYQAAILARLARRVYAIERHRPLVRQAAQCFAALDLSNVSVVAGDGTMGWPEQAPFDRILVTAAAEDAPSYLLRQLRQGGIMVLPVGQSDDVQQLLRIEKTADGLDYQELGAVRFVPLLEGIADGTAP